MTQDKFDVGGMTCAACQAHVDRAVSKLDGVQSVAVNLLAGSMLVDYDPAQVSPDDICTAVDRAGYSASPVSTGTDAANSSGNAQARSGATHMESPTKKLEATASAMRTRLIISIIFLIPLFYIGMGHMLGWPLPSVFTDHTHSMTLALTELVLLIPIVYVNDAYFINGFKSLAHGAPTMDALIAVGATASIAWSLYAMFIMADQLATGQVHEAMMTSMDNLYFESAGTILSLVTVGKYLETRSKSKTGGAIEALIDLAPKTATVVADDGTDSVEGADDGANAAADAGYDDVVLADPLTVMQTDASITVEGSTFRYVLDRRTGLFSSMSFANRSLLNRPMELNVWRAPADNDQYIKADWIRAQYDRAQARAYEVGVLVDEDDIIAKPESIELRADDEDAPVASFGDDAILDDGNVDAGDVSAIATSEDGSVVVDGQVTIHATMALVAPIVQRIADIDADWTIAPDGSVALRMHVMRDTDFPFLPRFGLRLFVPKTMRQIAYCGLGPNESYIDKRRSSYHGVFSGTPESLFEPYIKPQENGNHHDCDWASVASDDDELLVLRAGDHAFDFQALPYTQEELTAKAHNSELKPADSTVVCVDYMQSGVGSNSCGPKLHEKYRLDDAEFDFDLVLRPQAL